MFKPLLAPRDCPETKPGFLQNLPFPLYVSPKYDGIRGLTKDGSVKSRSFKDLPSKQVQNLFSKFHNLDGEIMVGNPTDEDVYNRTQSYVMSKDKPAERIAFFVFDWIAEGTENIPYKERLQEAGAKVKQFNDLYRNEPGSNILVSVPQQIIKNVSELVEYEQSRVDDGFEGIMMRGINSRYKHGRATYNEGIIYKLKRFIDDEGKVIGFEEAMINMNEQEIDELGYSKRSSHQANKVPAGRVGKFIVSYKGQVITVSPGNFTHPELVEIWQNQGKHIDRYLKFRYFGHGIKDLPRHPRAIGWRHPMDM